MSPVVRRLVYVTIYEAIAITIVAISLAIMLQRSLWDTGSFTLLSSLIATVWNFIFNSVFEFWEKHQTVKGRSVKLRIAHAASFEIGLMAIFTPFMAWYLEIGLLEAFVYDLGYSVFFLVYTYTFNLGFDAIFGLPESAR